MTITTLKREKSAICFEEAKKILVGGVDSPVRSFKAVGGSPVFFKKGKGPFLYSEDGEQLIDYVLSWGPLLFGHADADVVAAIAEAASLGTSFGAPSKLETELALLVQEFFPTMERIRFVSSGTEATMSAIRLARGATGRKKILKFNGCYHGHADQLLVKAGSGGLTFGIPDSKGVIPEVAEHTLSIEYNDPQVLETTFKQFHQELACVIIEPVSGNMGVIVPDVAYMKRLRELCTYHGVILIFDEVMTGFRVEKKGAQHLFQIRPDLTCLGKVIGAGMPCAAYGGRRDLMECVAPLGSVYQAGTLSGNPVVMAAGLTMLKKLKKNPELFDHAIKMTSLLCSGLERCAAAKKIPLTVNQCGTLFTFFFNEGPVQCLADVMRSDVNRFKQVFHGLLDHGVYVAPSQFEANFLSVVHTEREIQKTVDAFSVSLEEIH